MENSLKNQTERIDKKKKFDDLETIPSYGMQKLNLEEVEEIKVYLGKVFIAI